MAEERKPRAGSRARKPKTAAIGTGVPVVCGPVEAAVRAELGPLREKAPAKVSAGMLEVAFVLAARLDDRSVSATAHSMCAAKLREIVQDVYASVPEAPVKGAVARIREKQPGGLRAV